MERLTTQFMYGLGHTKCYGACSMCDVVGYCDLLEEIFEKLKHYEDLEEQGRLIALPCKVGDAVYEILPPCDDTLLCETFQKFFISRYVNKECGHYIQIKQFRIELLEKFGNTVFLTKEEAEAKLKEMRGAE